MNKCPFNICDGSQEDAEGEKCLCRKTEEAEARGDALREEAAITN